MAAPPRRRRHQHGRRTTKRRAATVGPLVVLVLLALACGAGFAAWHSTRHGGSAAALDNGFAATTPAAPGGGTNADAGALQGPSVSPGGSKSAAPGRTSEPPSGDKDATVPSSGTGEFSTAQASGSAWGHGTIRRYKVEVEDGIDLEAASAAHEIAGILADPRGWTADGRDGFQLVSSGPADFVIKIATPDTVDDICGAAGLLTHGEVNCDVGDVVVVNLKRWMLGSPEFHGPVQDYRALIINHEVGHRIGHGHEGCPGPGKAAPVMMQQIYGLHGCTANQWPYDSHGHYVQGPPVA